MGCKKSFWSCSGSQFAMLEPKQIQNELNLREEHMRRTMERDDARALLQSTQALRIHWSGLIITYVGYAMVANVAVWSYFLKAYIDSLAASSGSQPLYIGVAAAVSSTLLGLWRFYTRYIDDHIAGIYPDFLLYESKLGVPPAHQTSGYLVKAVRNVSCILLALDLKPEQKLEGIRRVIKSKRIGRRGHLWFDLSVLAAILVMLGGSFYVLRSDLCSFSTIGCFLGIVFGLSLTLFEFFFYQREPSKNFIEKTLSTLKILDKTNV